MSFEGFDEWDEKFLDQAIRVEEEVISTRNATQVATSLPVANYSFLLDSGSFSPPRELSQRFSEKPSSFDLQGNDCQLIEPSRTSSTIFGTSNKAKEIERLKRELGHVSEQLNQLQHECSELKKERDEKDEQLKSVFSQLKAKDAHIHDLKRSYIECEASMQDHPQLQHHKMSTSVDKIGTSLYISGAKGTLSTSWPRENSSKKLSCNTKNSHEQGPIRKDHYMDGLPSTSELKRRTCIDNALTTSNGCSVEGIALMETAVRPMSTKAIGIQTDWTEEHNDLSNKLHEIWNTPSGKISGNFLISKLLVAHASDFYALFRFMGSSSRITMDSLQDKIVCDATFHEQMQPAQSVEAGQVSQLYKILTMVNNEMVKLDALLEALLGLCILENANVVYRSLRIVHGVLQLMLNFGTGLSQRDNVVVTQSQNTQSQNVNCFKDEDNIDRRDKTVEFHKLEKMHNEARSDMCWVEKPLAEFFSSSTIFQRMDTYTKARQESSSVSTSFSSVNLLSLFEIMHEIAVGNNEESIRVEAISTMILILTRSHPNSEREKFGLLPLFESMAKLLRKEAGLLVQKQSLRLLFVLLNCPKLLKMFCGNCEDVYPVEAPDHCPKEIPPVQGFDSILEGLAECVACRGSGTEVLKLRRHAIIVLAFVASSGKSGFNILMTPSSPKEGMSFLELIVRVLALEMDAEVEELAKSHEICLERTLLMREALILLNRLASNPVYSTPVLSMLTSSRAMANLTVDVAERMSRKNNAFQKSKGAKRMQTKEAEIADLARMFKTRIFAFFGNNNS